MKFKLSLFCILLFLRPLFSQTKQEASVEFNKVKLEVSVNESGIPHYAVLHGSRPVIFKLRNYAQGAPDRQMHTTLAKQLALYVTMYSPLQMAADMPENYEAHMDAFRFIKDVAVDWDDTKIIDAEPGDYITIARKGKATPNWFMGAITNEAPRTKSIPLNFLDKNKKYIATIYRDAPDSDWKTKPEAYKIDKYIVTHATILKINLAPGGGAAISMSPASRENIEQLKEY